MHHLQGGTEDGLAQVGVGLEDRAIEAVHPAIEPAACWDERALVFFVGNDLSKFGFDVFGVCVAGHGAGREPGTRLLNTASLDEETRGVWEEEQTTTKDQAPGELDADRNAVGAGVCAVLDGVVDDGSQHDTNGDAELIAGDESAADFAWADLRHVQDDNGGLETDAKTSDQTTSNDQAKTVCERNLENDTYRTELASILRSFPR